jgi:hypothetical protein
LIEIFSAGIPDRPKPGRSGATTRWESMNSGRLSSQFCQQPPRPCTKISAGASSCPSGGPLSTTLTCTAEDRQLVGDRRPVDAHPAAVVAVGIVVVRDPGG